MDVAFSVGTLAINSIVPDAFSAIELRQLTKLAEVLDGGFRRLADLKRLASSEARFRALVESSGAGVLMVARNGNFVYVSPTIERLTGYPPSAYEGNLDMGFAIADDAFHGAGRRAVRRAFGGQAEEDIPFM